MKTKTKDEKEMYLSVTKQPIKEPIAYCKSHKKYLTYKQMKLHKCTIKGCTGLQKIDCEYWKEKNRRKAEAKERKRRYKGD